MSSSRKSRSEKDREKVVQDRLQVLLTHMLKDEDNKYCVDCDAKGPRWASWNLGLFLCIRCAGIHRNLGVHISKVKSVNLDSWTPSQVASMQLMGNSRARAVYEANLPDNFKRPQSDQSLEQFIRAKYERTKYIAREYVATKPPDLPEGWYELIEAEKSKKDIRKIVLPSHTHKSGSQNASPTKEEASTARPKASPASAAAAAAAPKAASVSSPPPVSAAATTAAPAQPKKTSPSEDLLGLGLGGGEGGTDFLGLGNPAPTSAASSSGGFNAFVSAPSASTTTSSPASNAATPKQSANAEETAFFSQSSGAATEASKKSTKDSILALYGQMPAAPPPQPQQQQQAAANMFMNGSGLMHNSSQPAQQQSQFGGMQGFGAPAAQQQQQPVGGGINFGSNNPFLSNTGGSPAGFNASPQQQQQPGNMNGMFGGANQMGQVQNQFGGLNLGNGFPAAPSAAPVAGIGANFGAFNMGNNNSNGGAPTLNPTKPANPTTSSMDPLSLWQ